MIIASIFVVGCSIWVYWDATNHNVGRIPELKELTNMSAGAWSAVTLGLWIIGFPGYLMNRSRLIKAAKQSPIKVGYRVVKTGVIILFGCLWINSSMG